MVNPLEKLPKPQVPGTPEMILATGANFNPSTT